MDMRPRQRRQQQNKGRRVINQAYTNNPNRDFYSNEPLAQQGSLWHPGIARGDFGEPEGPMAAMNRPGAFSRAQGNFQPTAMAPFKSTGGSGSGYMMSHDPHLGEDHSLFSEKSSDDLSFQAMQQGGDPWFSSHQQATRFAQNFMPQGIRRQRIDQQRANSTPFE